MRNYLFKRKEKKNIAGEEHVRSLKGQNSKVNFAEYKLSLSHCFNPCILTESSYENFYVIIYLVGLLINIIVFLLFPCLCGPWQIGFVLMQKKKKNGRLGL